MIDLADFLADFYAGCSNLVEFLKIRVVIIENAPELQIFNSSLIKFGNDLLLLMLDDEFADKINEFQILQFGQFTVDSSLEGIEFVVFVEGELLEPD